MENRNASIGLFVIGGLLLFGIGMFVVGDRHQAFAHHTEYYSEFVNLAGLAKGAKAVSYTHLDVYKRQSRVLTLLLSIGVPAVIRSSTSR